VIKLNNLGIRHNREGKPLRFAERLLLSICRPVDGAPLSVATYSYTLDNALDYATRMIPNFPDCLRGRAVLDYGCGPGWQALAMRRAGATSVHGVDINAAWLETGRKLAAHHGISGVEFAFSPPADSYDVVISLNAMEHFRDAERELERICSLARERVIISFAEPWFSPYGTHLNGTTRLPWLNFLFSERTLMNVRNLYPDGDDGATRFEEVRGGLNKMTVRRFEQLVHSAPGFRPVYLRHRGIKGVPVVDRVPVLREMLISCCTCILEPRRAT
jgi:SAM-dependent methyltransferase